MLSAARDMPELSCRQLAAWTTDKIGFSVSESTVYRILRREGLVKRAEMRLAAGKEYHRKRHGMPLALPKAVPLRRDGYFFWEALSWHWGAGRS